MKLGFFALLFLVLFPLNISAKQIVFIVDASGSMADSLGIYEKMHLAKREITKISRNIPEKDKIVLIAYGNRIRGCGSARIYSGSNESRKHFIDKLYGLTPSGSTPLALTLRLVGKALNDQEEAEIILITDGMESCNGDPAFEIDQLKRQGHKFSMHILGLGLKPEAETNLKILSEAANGSFQNILRPNDLEETFKVIFPSQLKQLTTDRFHSDFSDMRLYFKDSAKNEKELFLDYDWKNTSPGKEMCIMLYQMPIFKNQSELLEGRIFNLEKTRAVNLFCPSSNKGTLRIPYDSKQEYQYRLELWDFSGIPKVIAKSDSLNPDS